MAKKYRKLAQIFGLLCDIRKLPSIPDGLLNRINIIVDANYKSETLQIMNDQCVNWPLSDEQLKELMPIRQSGWSDETMLLWMARAVEQAHGITMSHNSELNRDDDGKIKQ